MRWTRKKKVIWGASRALKWSDCQMGRGMKRTAGQGLGIGGESWLGSWKSSWTSQFESCQGVQGREIWRVSPRYRGGGTLEGVDGTDGGIGDVIIGLVRLMTKGTSVIESRFTGVETGAARELFPAKFVKECLGTVELGIDAIE